MEIIVHSDETNSSVVDKVPIRWIKEIIADNYGCRIYLKRKLTFKNWGTKQQLYCTESKQEIEKLIELAKEHKKFNDSFERKLNE